MDKYTNELIRDDFPFFEYHPILSYLDNAATTLKPKVVIDTVVQYYQELSSNIHRGDYDTSYVTSELFEGVRNKTAKFIGCESEEIIFTSGASESLNLIAYGYARSHLKKGDVVLLNESEHASNILPWYELTSQGVVIEFIKLDKTGRVTEEALRAALHDKVKLVSMSHISNVLGYINDVKSFAKIIHEQGALYAVDGAQSIGHVPVDVKDFDVDFFAFSAHKALGPTGVGVLYGKYELLNDMHPMLQGGGNNLTFDMCGHVTYKSVPYRFESGTPNIEGVLGFGAALDYLMELGMENVHKLIHPLVAKALELLENEKHIHIYNKGTETGIITFSVEGIFAQDVAQYLNANGIAVRAGEHCAKMLNGALHAQASVRASFYIYNTMRDVESFVDALKHITLEGTLDFL